MLVAVTISILYHTANGHLVPVSNTRNDGLVECLTYIVTEYFAQYKELTYVESSLEDGEILKSIHALGVIATVSKSFDQKLNASHKGYFVSMKNYNVFVEHFKKLAREATWYPGARFLIVVENLEDSQLEDMFNELLRLHVINVLVVNGTDDAQLYTYNPYDNYGCGKRYEDIIRYGKCDQARSTNLYPKKIITGLRNCTMDVLVPHWPPYAIIPTNNSNKNSHLKYGLDPYFFTLIGEMSGFTLNIIFDKGDNESFSTVNTEMEVVGTLKPLQDNQIDVILGGYLLIPTRANAFSYIYDLLPYVDEIRFIVHHAELLSGWKYVYLEFDVTVWILVVLSVIFYSIIMIMVLRAQDKSKLVLKLVDNLLLHSCKMHCQYSIKWIFIAWVWFAYLINTFYQSSLVSLTTNPVREKQISTEAEINQHNLKPCIADVMFQYSTESSQSQHTNQQDMDCSHLDTSIKKVIKYKDYYSFILYGLYMYSIQDYRDRYGNPQIYSLKKPHSKVIYCMYFQKGFPLISELQIKALRVREMGLVGKAISDLDYLKAIKYHFHTKEYKTLFVMPWSVYAVGCLIAGVTLIIELLSLQK